MLKLLYIPSFHGPQNVPPVEKDWNIDLEQACQTSGSQWPFKSLHYENYNNLKKSTTILAKNVLKLADSFFAFKTQNVSCMEFLVWPAW